jgi:hypothetical protein
MFFNRSGNKVSKDIPIILKSFSSVQDELYFPYSTAYPNHEIYVSINSIITDLSDINSGTLDIDFTLPQNARKKDRGVEIYNIQSRYKAQIAKDSYKWKERIIKKRNLRCKQNGVDFQIFKIDISNNFTDYCDWNNGIQMKCFDEFVLNYPNC